jgi:hypothetical protein
MSEPKGVPVSADLPGRYSFDGRDRGLLTASTSLLKRVTAAKILRPAELVSVAKLLHALSRLPRVTLVLDVRVYVSSPRRKFGEIETWHWWEVVAEHGLLTISSGGSADIGAGLDSFTTMEWAAFPGKPVRFNDYRERHRIVPDVLSFPESVETIDFDTETYTLEIDDPDNSLLENLRDTDEAGIAREVDLSVVGEDAEEILEEQAVAQNSGQSRIWRIPPTKFRINGLKRAGYVY